MKSYLVYSPSLDVYWAAEGCISWYPCNVATVTILSRFLYDQNQAAADSSATHKFGEVPESY